MLERLIEMIERNAGNMAEDLKQRLLSDPETSSYQSLPARTLYANIFGIYSRLGHWLLRDSEKERCEPTIPVSVNSGLKKDSRFTRLSRNWLRLRDTFGIQF